MELDFIHVVFDSLTFDLILSTLVIIEGFYAYDCFVTIIVKYFVYYVFCFFVDMQI